MSNFATPEEIFTDDQLRRFYAVQATGGVKDTTDQSADSVVAVAQWILGGDERDDETKDDDLKAEEAWYGDPDEDEQ